MRRRKLRWILAAGLVVLFAAGALALWPLPQSQITPGNQRRIVEGMSRAEGENIFGGPPGDYRTNTIPLYRGILLRRTPGGRQAQWIGDEADVCVSFDCNGRVVEKDLYQWGNKDLGTLANAAFRIQRHLQRMFR